MCFQDSVTGPLPIADSQKLSPTLRSMIKVKAMVAVFLRCSIGDGKSVNFWYNYWTDLGLLLTAFDHIGPYDLQISLEFLVCAAAVDGSWSLPPVRSEVM